MPSTDVGFQQVDIFGLEPTKFTSGQWARKMDVVYMLPDPSKLRGSEGACSALETLLILDHEI